MTQIITTITLPEEIRRKGKEAAKRIFGNSKKFSTYLQMLISEDCEKRNIK